MGGARRSTVGLRAGVALIALALGATFAFAQEAQVDFTDAANGPAMQGPVLDLQLRDRTDTTRYAPPAAAVRAGEIQGPRRLELELAAGGGDAPIDVSIAQRASIGADSNGDLNRRGTGQELRVGSGLVRDRDTSGEPSVYMFVASDDEALTWEPGARSEFGGRGSSLALQERVEVGDMSAGVTYERDGVQASLAYVEREQSARVGGRTVSQDQAFTGVTVTVRH